MLAQVGLLDIGCGYPLLTLTPRLSTSSPLGFPASPLLRILFFFALWLSIGLLLHLLGCLSDSLLDDVAYALEPASNGSFDGSWLLRKGFRHYGASSIDVARIEGVLAPASSTVCCRLRSFLMFRVVVGVVGTSSRLPFWLFFVLRALDLLHFVPRLASRSRRLLDGRWRWRFFAVGLEGASLS
jgi:hypothetical protein